MIKLSLATAFMLYLGVSLFFLLGTWIYYHYKGRRKIIVQLQRELFVCEFCHYSYLKEGIEKVHRCPQCQSLNN